MAHDGGEIWLVVVATRVVWGRFGEEIVATKEVNNFHVAVYEAKRALEDQLRYLWWLQSEGDVTVTVTGPVEGE